MNRRNREGAPIDWLQPWIERVPVGGLALDLGAGKGESARWLARRGLSVWAVDQDREVLAALRRYSSRHPGMHPVEARLPALPFAPASCHLILASAVLHFLRPSDLWLLADRIQRVLRPGGLLMAEVLTVADPAYRWFQRQAHRQVEPNTYREEGDHGWIHFFEPGELAQVFANLTPLHQEESRRAAPESPEGYRAGSLLIARRPKGSPPRDR